MLVEIRDWTMWLMEGGILYYVAREFYYDKVKDEEKKQRRTKTTRKITKGIGGESVTEESIENIEPVQEENK